MTSDTTQSARSVTAKRTMDWRSSYALKLVVSDLLVLVGIIFGVQIAWVGLDSAALGVSGSRGEVEIGYTCISVCIVAAWMAVLGIYGTRTDRVVGVGVSEYKLIANASVRLLGIIAILAFLFKVDLARGYILMSFPLGLAFLLLSRWMWRQWLGAKRRLGSYSSRVLLVGSEDSVVHIARQLARQPEAGYQVVGACVASGRVADTLPGTSIVVSGNLSDLDDALETTGADTVIITSSDELPPERVRELSWSLEPGRQHLVVAPTLTGIAGPRIHTRPVAGLPLIHVETPRYEGRKIFTKRTLDVLFSGVLLILLSPVFLAVAILVKLSSPGPVLFHQARIGIQGKQFRMLKFRSMIFDAEQRLGSLGPAARSEGNEILFKMKDDPRVTTIGRILRRFSLDELPQLLNVFEGSMSLVGPRPPLETEVSSYDEHVHRRFLVKPGITGLWQVSGRSNLDWEESVQLDLYYVENWSLTGDLIILWRTVRAVLSSEGAY
ncbi:exopolysaccharide biosynthesis polyprenyl glycosylphosphotransferase [Okibacterium sp. HSC-33S16]|uniref:sugar transferase n=1 Tax=Okibacterium sp. HSC-33S16 TaxID=2910965 RepID=UPI00209C96DE|nr:sugar transferase [Okibacterium sp. HSC-33S16]MCP2032148.1 exopolysaccharide biosynthesis polyprenyl glycosylphosphotransferase [Okibacterium sp. HSC-33S16]